MNAKSGYSGVQIGLHWLVALLVLFELFSGETMTLVIDAAEENDPVSAVDQTMATAHYWVGAIVNIVDPMLAKP